MQKERYSLETVDAVHRDTLVGYPKERSFIRGEVWQAGYGIQFIRVTNETINPIARRR